MANTNSNRKPRVLEDQTAPVAPVEVEAPANESKADKFTRLANARMRKMLKQFELLGNLANRGQYECTPEQVDTIFNRIRHDIEAVEAKFRKASGKAPIEFEL